MAALKKRYYQKIDEEVYSAILDSGMSLSIIKKKGICRKRPPFCQQTLGR